MGQTIINILTSPISLIDQQIGDIISGAFFTVAGIVTGNPALVAFGLSRLAGALSGGPPKPETTERAIKTSRPPRISAYGRSRLYGAYILYETAENGTAVDVYAIHDGELDGVEAYYLADEEVTLTGTAVDEGDDGRYRDDAVNIYTTDGSAPGAGLPAVTSLLSGIWTANHRGDGVVLLALTAKAVKAKRFQETYPQNGVPPASLVARWQKCPDPAAVDPLDESAWTWTENPVRQLLHYKLVREGPRPALPKSDAGYDAALQALRAEWYARHIAPTLQFWIDAAADCDSAVALAAGGTEPRYRSNVSHKHTDEHKGPVQAILSTFDGWLSPRADGALVIYSGRYYAPDPVDDLIGPDEIVSYTWEGGRPDDDKAVNEAVCNYVSAEHDYNTVEADPWRDEADIAARGKVLSDPLDIACPSHGQVRRLAKRHIARNLAQNRGTITTNLAGRHARGKRYIWLRLEEAGAVFYEGPAEITALTRAVRGGVTFDWVAADPNVDNWNAAAEEGQPAALGDRVAPAALVAPSISATSVSFNTDGARVQLTVDSPDRDDLTWYVHWRVQGATVWGPDEEYTDSNAGTAVTLVSGLVPSDALVEFQVAYQTGDGRFSEWSAVETVDTDSAALAPGPATNVTATGAAGEAEIEWRNPTTNNFGYVRIYRNTTTDFGTATEIAGPIAGGLGSVLTFTDTVAAGSYQYWVRAFSDSDVGATPTGPAAATVT